MTDERAQFNITARIAEFNFLQFPAVHKLHPLTKLSFLKTAAVGNMKPLF